jgi:hypothetical protein
MKKRMLSVVAVGVLAATSAWAEGTVQQKTQVHIGGAIGAIANVFGGKATHEGIESTVALKGNRKATRHGGSGEIIDLAEEKVYRVDYDRQTYSVVTFDEIRKQFEEQKARAERERDKNANAKNDGPEWDVDFDVKSTGKKETINNYATHQEVVTITVHEKGKKIEQSGGFVLTADMAMGPKVPAMQDIAEFDRKYVTKVYGSLLGGDAQQMSMMLAQYPAFGKAMKAFADKRSSFEGTPIRTILTFETVAGPATQEQTASRDDSSDSSSAAGAIVGGLMNKLKKRREQQQSASSSSTSSQGPARSSLFDSTVELLSASNSAAADAVMIPASFKKR